MNNEKIAIIAMQMRLPGASTPWELLNLLSAGEISIKHFSVDQNDRVGAHGQLQNYDYFDAKLFNISHAEAAIIDPQHRILLECAYQTLEMAGICPGKKALPIGVFASCSANQFHWRAVSAKFGNNNIASYSHLLANDKDFLATRIAYHLNLTGPSMSLQSGCSSGLLALHQACKALLFNECEMALVGAASISLPIDAGSPISEEMIFSPTGSCRPYTPQADGTVGGSGAVVYLLRRLEDAVNAGDDIWAVIAASAVNNDGRRKVGFTAPSVDGQIDVMQLALKRCQWKPTDVGYIEGHGTATKLGDAIELMTLETVYGNQSSEEATLPSKQCYLGSIKANIGHLDAASGLAGLAKCLLSIRFAVLFPQPTIKANKQSTQLAMGTLRMLTCLHQWEDNVRRAACCSLGVGGTNVHVLLEQSIFTRPAVSNQESYQHFWLPIAASSQKSLNLFCHQLITCLKHYDENTLVRVAATLQKRYGDTHFPFRYGIVSDSLDDVIQNLNAYILNKNENIKINSLMSKKIDYKTAYQANEDWLNGAAIIVTNTKALISLPATPLESIQYIFSAEKKIDSDYSNTISSLQPNELNADSMGSTSSQIIERDQLIKIWHTVLGHASVQKPLLTNDAHFFELGGNSLLAIQFIKLIKDRWQISFSIADLYMSPTFGEIYLNLSTQQSLPNTFKPIEKFSSNTSGFTPEEI